MRLFISSDLFEVPVSVASPRGFFSGILEGLTSFLNSFLIAFDFGLLVEDCWLDLDPAVFVLGACLAGTFALLELTDLEALFEFVLEAELDEFSDLVCFAIW